MRGEWIKLFVFVLIPGCKPSCLSTGQSLKKEFNSKFPEGYSDWKTAEEGCRTQQPKSCYSNNKYEDISPTVNK